MAAISGGVDSAVAAALSKSEYGVFMSNWRSDAEDIRRQCSEQDERDAKVVCEQLKIPLRRLSFVAEYWCQVFEPYVTALPSETGNPDVSCNRYIKFGALTERLKQIYGKDEYSLVTGHYARLWKRKEPLPACVQSSCSDSEIDWLRIWMADSDNVLLQAADTSKDQSYFLATCQASAMHNVKFPIGAFDSKADVRNAARELGLPNADKRDSVGLCFVPQQAQKSFSKFLSEYIPLPTRPVKFMDVDSHEIVNETDAPSHAFHYTRGQGAKIGGTPTKYFCVDTNESSNTVTVCQGTHHPSLYSTMCHVDSIIWWTGKPPDTPMRVLCRTRHLVPLVPATLIGTTVHFDTPVRAVTPGQYAVFYVGVVCLGGGKIVGYGNE